MGGLDDMVNKAKDALGGDEGVDAKIDQAADAAKKVAPEGAHGTIDDVAQKAKDAI